MIHVTYPDLNGMYTDKNYSKHELTLSKYAYEDKEKIGTSIDDMCISDTECGGLSYASNTYFVDNSFIYHIHYQGETIIFRHKNELSAFKKSIVDLFDSFKAR